MNVPTFNSLDGIDFLSSRQQEGQVQSVRNCHCERKGVFMKKLVVLIAMASVTAAIIDVSDASAQSWGRRGANVRCTNGGVVHERWYCNLKNAPAGPWNNYRSRRQYELRQGMNSR
jgi:hypothetical protein